MVNKHKQNWLWVYDTGCEGLWHCQQFSLSVWGFISLLSHMLQDLRSYHIVHMYKPVWEQLVMLKIGNYRYYISLFKDNTAFMTYIWKQFHVKEVDWESVDCLCFRPSPILLALDIEEDVARRAIRLSVGRETTQEDIDCAVNDLKQAVEKIQSKNTCISAQRVE